MTNQEAFALHMRSMFMDALNGETGLLRCIAEKMSPDVMDDAHGCLRDTLLSMADALQKKLARVKGDIEEFCGGEDRLHDLFIQDFDSGFTLSAYQCLSDDNPRKKYLKTCRTCLHAIDGFCNEVQKPWTSEISDKGSCDKWRGSY